MNEESPSWIGVKEGSMQLLGLLVSKTSKPNLQYTRDITPKSVTSGGPISTA